jgi:hypothetical protein
VDRLEPVRGVGVPHQRERAANPALASGPVDRDRDVRRLPLFADDQHALAAFVGRDDEIVDDPRGQARLPVMDLPRLAVVRVARMLL